ncbi:hypothetical protein Hdeb2414_s0026g00672291 [Helianthus debilis subsp. tardiflorus]
MIRRSFSNKCMWGWFKSRGTECISLLCAKRVFFVRLCQRFTTLQTNNLNYQQARGRRIITGERWLLTWALCDFLFSSSNSIASFSRSTSY